jgi:hypothetical protein
MLSILRVALLALSVSGSGFMLYLLATERGAPWVVYAFAAGLALNSVYLAIAQPAGSGFRIFRLVGLWLDAKEAELRERTQRPKGS